MLIAVISDTHLPRGDRRLPDACVERLRAADLILHAGDVITATTYAEIEAIGPAGRSGCTATSTTTSCAAGSRRSGPSRRTARGSRWSTTPGRPRAGSRGMRARFPEADAVVFGHSHLPLHEEEDGFQIFNPGSPTDRRRAPAHTMGLARVEAGAVEFELVGTCG